MDARFKAAGGTLGSTEPYIEREADTRLIERLAGGDYCYVLAPRQSGKSSLALRTAEALKKLGIATVRIDLAALVCIDPEVKENGITSEQLERLSESQLLSSLDSLIQTICVQMAEDLKLYAPARSEPKVAQVWQEWGDITPTMKWSSFITHEVLGRSKKKIVVFMDEIEALSILPRGADSIYQAIRSFFQKRTTDIAYQRLTFCLIGVQSQHVLTQSPDVSPFNIGYQVVLSDFSRGQIENLRPLLSDFPAPDPVLDTVHQWAGGHPWMTQFLLQGAVDERLSLVDEEACRPWIQRTVASLLGHPAVQYPKRYLTEPRLHEPKLFRDRALSAVKLYQHILDGSRIVYSHHDPSHEFLYLSGIVSRMPTKDGESVLRVRNPIFARAYDRDWSANAIRKLTIVSDMITWEADGRKPSRLLPEDRLDEAFALSQERRDFEHSAFEYLFHSAKHAWETRKASYDELARRRRERRNLWFLVALFALIVGGVAGYALLPPREVIVTHSVPAASVAPKQEKEPFGAADVARLSEIDPSLAELVDDLKLSEAQERARREWQRRYDELKTVLANAKDQAAFAAWAKAYLEFLASSDSRHALRAFAYWREGFKVGMSRGILSAAHQMWLEERSGTTITDEAYDEDARVLRLYHDYVSGQSPEDTDSALGILLEVPNTDALLKPYYPDYNSVQLGKELKERREAQKALYSAVILDCSNPEGMNPVMNGVAVREQLMKIGFINPPIWREQLNTGDCHKLVTDKCTYATAAGERMCRHVLSTLKLPDGRAFGDVISLQLAELDKIEQYADDENSDKIRRHVLRALFGQAGDSTAPADSPRHNIALRLGELYDNELRRIRAKQR